MNELAPKAPERIDAAALTAAAVDAAGAIELAHLFVETTGQDWAAIDAAWRERNHDTLGRQAHALRGSLALVGARAACAHALAIETACEEGRFEGLAAHLDALREELSAARNDMELFALTHSDPVAPAR